MEIAIVFLPLLGFIAAGPLGSLIGAWGSERITTGALISAAFLAWIKFFQLGYGGQLPSTLLLGPWLTSGSLVINWSLHFDTLTAVMLIVVTSVSALVHLYSIGYMHEDPHRPRFFAYLSLFTFAMLMLVTSDNLVQMFFGWEGVGLASYLLIGFWYEKSSANAAAIKAFVVNRVGDFGFALGIFLIFKLTGSIQFEAIFKALPQISSQSFVWGGGFEISALTLVCLLLFMGAMGKSAQFLLHTWLPDAMEGPTPVSALIHAATMVTAGVFMVARLSPLFELSESARLVVTGIGATTAFFAATVGLVQNDIKRVIAYSTCSQLGYMFVALGLGAYSIGIFHLFTHAFFKALLFLGAGSVIHALHHEQDMQKMGGVRQAIPITFAMMIIGTLSLTGFPLTAGYYSKDAIIETAFTAAHHSSVGLYAFVLTLLAAGLTSFYSWRLIFLTFFGTFRGHHTHEESHTFSHVESLEPSGIGHPAFSSPHSYSGSMRATSHKVSIHESPMIMLLPLGILAIGALFFGGLFESLFFGVDASTFWKSALVLAPSPSAETEHVSAWVAWLPTLMMAGGALVAFYMYQWAPRSAKVLAQSNPLLYRFLLNKWYIDELYEKVFVQPAFWLGRLFWKQGDGRLIDGWGPDGVSARVLDITVRFVRLQTGYIYHYAFSIFVGLVVLMTWVTFGGAY